MSKKNIDSFQIKITRNDRFAQMSHQEKLIEQKKREIQAKLDAKEKTKVDATKAKPETPTKSSSKSDLELKNAYSNDGSFLDQFKQLKETKKSDSKLRSFSKSKDRFSDDRSKPNNRWGPRRRSPSPKDAPKRVSRFSNEKMPSFESKITISTSFTNSLVHQQPVNPTPDVTNQPLLKNILPQAPSPPKPSETIVSTAPMLLDVQATQSDVANTLISAPLNLPTVAPVPPPVELAATPQPVELAAIPPPNPIQVQNIPQPEPLDALTIPQPAPLNALTIPQPAPLNAMTIPQPAPLLVQNIPTPSTLQLNQIPNPKPLDLMAIPTPSDNMSDPEFLKNIPPPNRSIPPPQMQETAVGNQTVLVASQPNQIDFSSVSVASSSIPSLMSQPVLPPPGMGLINMNCPPPMLSFVGQLPSMNVPPPASIPIGGSGFKDMNAGTPEHESMTSLGRMVAECGNSIEDIVRQRKNQDPNLWFLFHQESAAYRQYRRLIEHFKAEREVKVEPKLEDAYEPYEPEMALDDRYDDDGYDDYAEGKATVKTEEEENALERKRKRKSRWGEKDCNVPPPSVLMYNTAAAPIINPPMLPVTPQINPNQVMLSKLGRTDPGLLQYAVNTYGTTNLEEDDWKKVEDHYKINLLYQDMVRKREEVERLQMAGKHKYEYDSDEDTEGGTWEHKARDKEMMATELWAQELNRQAEGKHHIGDFLPPDELKRFMEKSTAVKEGREPNLSDYKEFKIKEDNVGFRMLQKLGWSEGEGLGSSGLGIVEPVNKALPRENTQGLGLNFNQPEEDEDEYESYRKRMMLAYRFRPNPLNNPRRPYY